MLGRVLLLSLDCSTLPLIHTFIMLSVKQVGIKFHFFFFFFFLESLVWLDLGSKPSLLNHWQTLTHMGWYSINTLAIKTVVFRHIGWLVGWFTVYLFYNNNLLALFCGFKYSYLILIIFKHIYLTCRWDSKKFYYPGSKWT